MAGMEAVSDLRELGATLRRVRHQRGLSLRQLAAATHTSINTLSKLERGGDVRLSTAIRMLEWLNAPPVERVTAWGIQYTTEATGRRHITDYGRDEQGARKDLGGEVFRRQAGVREQLMCRRIDLFGWEPVA